MFTYIEQDSLLHQLNPLTKFFLVLLITILISFSMFPVISFITLGLTILVIWLLGKVPLWELLKRMKAFFLIAASFMFCMLLLKGIGSSGKDVTFLFLSWSQKDFIDVITLGVRIVAIVGMSLGFVITTNPNDLVLSLIQQLKVPSTYGYATLAAYRFVPTLQSEVRDIKLAQQIRGIEWESGIKNRIKSPFRLCIPLLANAARHGERVALAMDARGLDKDKKRSFYRRTKITPKDIFFILATLIIYGIMIVLLVKYNLFYFNVGFQVH